MANKGSTLDLIFDGLIRFSWLVFQVQFVRAESRCVRSSCPAAQTNYESGFSLVVRLLLLLSR